MILSVPCCAHVVVSSDASLFDLLVQKNSVDRFWLVRFWERCASRLGRVECNTALSIYVSVLLTLQLSWRTVLYWPCCLTLVMSYSWKLYCDPWPSFRGCVFALFAFPPLPNVCSLVKIFFWRGGWGILRRLSLSCPVLRSPRSCFLQGVVLD